MIRLSILALFFAMPTLIAQDRELYKRSIDEIIREYTIIGDFNLKPEIRDNSKEIFWRYPVKLPRVQFPLISPILMIPKIAKSFREQTATAVLWNT